MLLLTGAVAVVVIILSLLVGCILLLARAVSVIMITPLMVGCMLLLTGAVAVVVIVPSVCGAEVTPTVWEGVVFNSVHRKYTQSHQ